MAKKYKPFSIGFSILTPLLLIVLGVVFGLKNLNILQGDVWGTILKLWPLIFIFLGLDGLLKRDSFVGVILLIALGAVFLLNNFNFLDINVWELIFRLWPLLLIAFGIDLVIGKRSIIFSIVGLIIMVALLVGALWLFGVRVNQDIVMGVTNYTETLSEATDARITIKPAIADLKIDSGGSSHNLITVTIPKFINENVNVSSELSNGTKIYSIRESQKSTMRYRGVLDQWNWKVKLAEAIPMELKVDLGIGNMNLDLRDISLKSLDVHVGIGKMTIKLPPGQYSVFIDGGIGEVIIYLPEGQAVKIEGDTGISTMKVPDGFRFSDGKYTSSNYLTSTERIEIRVKQGIGKVDIR